MNLRTLVDLYGLNIFAYRVVLGTHKASSQQELSSQEALTGILKTAALDKQARTFDQRLATQKEKSNSERMVLEAQLLDIKAKLEESEKKNQDVEAKNKIYEARIEELQNASSPADLESNPIYQVGMAIRLRKLEKDRPRKQRQAEIIDYGNRVAHWSDIHSDALLARNSAACNIDDWENTYGITFAQYEAWKGSATFMRVHECYGDMERIRGLSGASSSNFINNFKAIKLKVDSWDIGREASSDGAELDVFLNTAENKQLCQLLTDEHKAAYDEYVKEHEDSCV
jgi:hypothetical protein